MQGKSCGISTKSLTGNTLDLRRYCKSRVDCELPASFSNALSDPLISRGFSLDKINIVFRNF